MGAGTGSRRRLAESGVWVGSTSCARGGARVPTEVMGGGGRWSRRLFLLLYAPF